MAARDAPSHQSEAESENDGMALNFDEFPPLPSRTRGVSHGDELRASLLQFQTQNSLRAQRAIAQQGSRNIVFGETETVVVAGNDVDVPVVKMGQDKYRLRDVADVGAATRPVSDLVLWRKEDRAGLDLEHKQVFIKHATGYVLSKGDKLSLPNYKTNDDGTLVGLHHVRVQLRTLDAHMVRYDLATTNRIVIPTNLETGPDTQAESYDLFADYPRLSDTMVALSNAWWRRWVNEPWVAENLQYSSDLIKNNTEPSLWAKAVEDAEAYAPDQQGGPLMVCLILARIQDMSEDAIGYLQKQVKTFSVKSLAGEDIDIVVSFVKSSYKAFLGASRPEKSFVPDDFIETLFELFQTTSVPAFNEVFADTRGHLVRSADMTGKPIKWPSVNQVTTLATKSYHRLLTKHAWTAPAAPHAMIGETRSPFKGICFNCGGDHLLPQCTLPRDETKITAAKDAYNSKRASRPSSTGRGGGRFSGRGDRGGGRGGRGPPRTRTGRGGRPMVLNKNGAYVVDTKKWKAQKLAAAAMVPTPATTTDALFRSYMAANVADGSTPGNPTGPAPVPPETEIPFRPRPRPDDTVTLDRAAFAEALSRGRGL